MAKSRRCAAFSPHTGKTWIHEPWGENDLHANGCSVRAVLSADEWEETRRAQHGNVGVTYQISLATHNRLLEALD